MGHLTEIRLCSPSSDSVYISILKKIPLAALRGLDLRGMSRRGRQFGATSEAQGRDASDSDEGGRWEWREVYGFTRYLEAQPAGLDGWCGRVRKGGRVLRLSRQWGVSFTKAGLTRLGCARRARGVCCIEEKPKWDVRECVSLPRKQGLSAMEVAWHGACRTRVASV